MNGFNGWDGVLLLVAGYVAVTSLVRLMANHRQKITEELRTQIEAEQRRLKETAAAKGKQPASQAKSA